MMERSADFVPEKSLIALAPEFSDVRVKTISFASRFYRCPWGEQRSVYIHSPKIEIFNLFFFPNDKNASPVYAMEFVRMVNRMVVAVIDVVGNPEDQNSQSFAAGIIRPHREHCADIAQGDDPPEWFQECRSGSDFFVRPSNLEQMITLKEAHFAILESYLAARADWPTAEIADDSQTGENWQAQYKSHHAANSPGLPFLNRTFGEDWTHAFLHNYLFA